MMRAYLVSTQPKKLGHVVMLGPPNKVSKVVDVMQALAGFEWVVSPARPPAEHGPQKPAQSIAVDHLLAGDYLWAGEL